MPTDFLTPEALFSLTSPLALAGWLALALTPLAPRPALMAGGVVIPLILCVSYALALALWMPGTPGGFDSLANVQLMFTAPGAMAAGWIHYLAFDLLIGAWQVRDARDNGLPHLAVLPCLFLTLMLGPLGLLCYLILRTFWTRKATLA